MKVGDHCILINGINVGTELVLLRACDKEESEQFCTLFGYKQDQVWVCQTVNGPVMGQHAHAIFGYSMISEGSCPEYRLMPLQGDGETQESKQEQTA